MYLAGILAKYIEFANHPYFVLIGKLNAKPTRATHVECRTRTRTRIHTRASTSTHCMSSSRSSRRRHSRRSSSSSRQQQQYQYQCTYKYKYKQKYKHECTYKFKHKYKCKYQPASTRIGTGWGPVLLTPAHIERITSNLIAVIGFPPGRHAPNVAPPQEDVLKVCSSCPSCSTTRL